MTFARTLVLVATMTFVAWSHVGAASRDLDYERLSANLAQLESDPNIAALAPGDLARARTAVLALKESRDSKERVHLAYVAERRLDIARVLAQAIVLERQVADLRREHDRILLEATRRDAELARLELEKQRILSLAHAEEADRLRAEADEARAQSEAATQLAEAAQAEADQARRVVAAQADETALARKEAELADAAAIARLARATPANGPHGPQITIDDAAFGAGRADLKPAAKNSLGAIVAFVNSHPRRAIRVDAYTDSSGRDDINRALSQRRADAVRDALVAAGVDAARITATGLGEADPIARNDTPEGRSKNRRVEVILVNNQ